MEEKIFSILEDICEEDLRSCPDTDMFQEELLDSLGMVRLLVEIEDRLGISLSILEFDKELINTPNKMIAFLKGKQ